MKFLHSMVRVQDLDASLKFYCDGLGLKEIRRHDYSEGQFSLIFLAAEEGESEIELTHNWNSKEDYENGRNFGHLAFSVENIYKTCSHLESQGITISRPPSDGRMAFIKSPDGISIELLQEGDALAEDSYWKSMKKQGSW